MKSFIIICFVLCAVAANPVPEKDIDMLRIPLEGDKELDVLTLADEDGRINARNKRTLSLLRELFPSLTQVTANDAENSLDASAINSQLVDSIRVVRETIDAASENAIEQEQTETKQIDDQDQQTAESKSPAIDELSLDNEEVDENRNKRFLNFGFGASSGNSAGGGSGGGSGNFLFDIIRRTADRAARAAGTVYRVVAGTESLDIGDAGSLRTSTTITKKAVYNDGTTNNGDNPLLVSGGSGTQQTDEKENAPEDEATTKTDGYTEGIPGPVTRLFVLANRGLSNLIQDLILRVAQTSERVVNFKARLITSLI